MLITDLDRDSLAHCFSFLNDNKDYVQVKRVCKYFKEISSYSHIQRSKQIVQEVIRQLVADKDSCISSDYLCSLKKAMLHLYKSGIGSWHISELESKGHIDHIISRAVKRSKLIEETATAMCNGSIDFTTGQRSFESNKLDLQQNFSIFSSLIFKEGIMEELQVNSRIYPKGLDIKEDQAKQTLLDLLSSYQIDKSLPIENLLKVLKSHYILLSLGKSPDFLQTSEMQRLKKVLAEGKMLLKNRIAEIEKELKNTFPVSERWGLEFDLTQNTHFLQTAEQIWESIFNSKL
ncbi:MAG: hypothetical protein K0S74_282 [Chlamydiales bacterium]|jgi:ethanolamine utilization protein EutQ (cupin superfamily)|nr:hypothetical protein [Chlamydiales bacterium]